jgi:catechol 2,3-dioxygenase-like lactoylglutathione lyase family enzyme
MENDRKDTCHHIALPVLDIAAAAQWYRENFDAEPVFQDESWAMLRFDNIGLALVLPEQHPAHLVIERPDAECFGPLKAHRDGSASVYIQEPWHNTIEVLKPGCDPR